MYIYHQRRIRRIVNLQKKLPTFLSTNSVSDQVLEPSTQKIKRSRRIKDSDSQHWHLSGCCRSGSGTVNAKKYVQDQAVLKIWIYSTGIYQAAVSGNSPVGRCPGTGSRSGSRRGWCSESDGDSPPTPPIWLPCSACGKKGLSI
jgi:hypothetical protein